MLKIKNMNSNNVIRQGDSKPREYQLDTGNLNLNLTNKSATIRLMTADFQGIAYETTATVSSENKISFSIDDVIPAREYRLEITVDDYVFPSRATDGRFDIDPSSHGQEVNIIQIIGKDEIVREVKARVDNELEPLVTSLESAQQAELDRQAQEEAREATFTTNEQGRQEVIRKSLEELEESVKIVGKKRTSNLFNEETLLYNKSVDFEGNLIDEEFRVLSDFIEVRPNEEFRHKSSIMRLIYYDENKNFVARIGNVTPGEFKVLNIPRIRYMRVSPTIHEIRFFMLNRGNKLLPYEPFYKEEAYINEVALYPHPKEVKPTQVYQGHQLPLWLTRDGKILLGVAGGQILQSKDEWETRQNVGEPLPRTVIGLRELDNGNLLATTVRENDVENAKIYLIENYNRDNPSAATFKEVLVSLVPRANFDHYWGISVYGNIICASEYGLWGETGGRYAYISKDFGETWEVIFDMVNEAVDGRPSYVARGHVHTIEYDPYYQRIWLSVGDGSNTATYFSDNEGDSWTFVEGSNLTQYTGIIAMQDAVIFGSDRAPNGLYIYKRNGKDKMPVITRHLAINNVDDITHIFKKPFRRNNEPNTPVYFNAVSAGTRANTQSTMIAGFANSKKAHILLETDKLYAEGENFGIATVLGDTHQGNVFYVITDNTINGYRVMKFPAPEWLTIEQAQSTYATKQELANAQLGGDVDLSDYSKIGHTHSEYALKSQVKTDVPANAKFTDTTYTAGTGINITGTTISATGEGQGGYDDTAIWAQINRVPEYVASRGQNLVTNGTGLLKDNTNFSETIFDGSDTYGSNGSFTYSNYSGTLLQDELIPIDPSETYRFAYYIKANPYVGARAHGMVTCYDSDGQRIQPHNTMYIQDTLTELVQDLKPGDTKVYLKDVSNWNNAGTAGNFYLRTIILWNYVSQTGYQYPPLSYSRNSWLDMWDPGAIDFTENSITLNKPWDKGFVATGTKLSNGTSGSVYKYIAGLNFIIPENWERYSGTISGIDTTGTNYDHSFHPGTASIKIGWFLNRDIEGSKSWLTNVSFGLDLITNDRIAKLEQAIIALGGTI